MLFMRKSHHTYYCVWHNCAIIYPCHFCVTKIVSKRVGQDIAIDISSYLHYIHPKVDTGLADIATLREHNAINGQVQVKSRAHLSTLEYRNRKNHPIEPMPRHPCSFPTVS